jgi:HD-GYP domain-containing protein (c-di-GMP phosphodiesterase class II)
LELVDDLGSTAEIALILSSLRRHDEYTYDHSINVGLLSICLAQALGWRGRDLHEFGIAALIHDVGKLYTPVEVLNKPGRLSPQEWIVMKRHPRDGYDILREGGSGSPDAPLIALEHHIGPDGRGYPSLAHKGMHPGSEIVKIADVYDAFTTIRPYRSQSRPQEVLKLLRKQAGRQFNAEYVEVFCEMMGEYPIGSTVKLRSGRIGLVVDVHLDDPKRPLVRILQDENGRRPRNMVLADLRHEEPDTGLHADEILETLDPVIRNIPIGRYI